MFTYMEVSNSMHLRCFVVSRPELEIRNALNDPSASKYLNQIDLGSSYNSENDIKIYLLSEFATIKLMHPLGSLLQLESQISWPSDNDVDTLVRRSSGQFIYASTVVKFIKHKRSDPRERLTTIIDIKPGQISPYAELDALYIQILSDASDNAGGYHNILLIFQALIHRNIYYCADISLPALLSLFLRITRQDLMLQLVDLHSIVYIPSSDDPGELLKFYHASFTDFVSDPSRSQEFFVSKAKAHVALGNCCLARILEHKFNTSENSQNSSIYQYSSINYLFHLAYSMFSNELIDKLFMHGDNNPRILIKEMLAMMKIQGLDFIRGGVFGDLLRKYYQLDPSAERGHKSLISSSTKSGLNIYKFIENEMDEVVINEFSTSINYQVNAVLAASTVSASNSNFYIRPPEYWIAKLIESPEKGGTYYMNDERSQYIFRIIWEWARTGKLYELYKNTNNFYNITQLPVVFGYLLGRIKPSAGFAEFLAEFTERDSWFTIVYEKNPPLDPPPFTYYYVLSDQEINDSIQSLNTTVHAYLKASSSLLNINSLRLNII
ncbi:hypothetical protein BDQ17DRAFT_342216 [Cyathus striatus]|nr:hypothetical protein BDQ17DRAFT_342216 [Cyathus striatus]